MARLFAGWRQDLASCRKFAPTARNYAAARLMAEVGLRVNEARHLDLDDLKWELGRFGKLHLRHGKGARGSGPRERMVPLLNNAGRTLRWFVEDVWAQLGDDHTRPGVPLLLSERKHADGTAARVSAETLRAGLAEAAARHLPDWPGQLTPHVLRHFCASQLYRGGWICSPSKRSWACLGGHHDVVRARPRHPRGGRLDRRSATRRRPTGRTPAMRWNLRLAAANRGIWKASELQHMLADHGLVISAGKLSGLWSGEPASIKLADLDVICAVLGCGVDELLTPEPDKVQPPTEGEHGGHGQPAAASPGSVGSARPPVMPKRRDGRSLPPA